MAKMKFEGKEYEYDENAIKQYRVLKAMSRVDSNPAEAFVAFELVFKGKDEEYAERLGGELDKFAELFQAVMEDAGEAAKN